MNTGPGRVAGASLAGRLSPLTGRAVPGIAAAIVGPGGLLDVAACGDADLAAGRPASAGMVCPWFSMTKIVTATMAMRLADQGLLDLDRPVAPLVPELAVVEPRRYRERITPRHLLAHSSGIANPVPVRWIHPADQPGPDQAALLQRLLARHRKLRFEPGVRSSYSNLGTLVLGRALSSAAGRAADPPFVEHLGGGAGFFNVIRMYPTREVGIAVMGNATRYDIDAVARLALS
jgi:CubicO group peptidase (beta-lactamase class C family)